MEKLTEKKKRMLKEFNGFICNQCHKEFKEEELEIHRIRREWQGGNYEFPNILVVCKECHKNLHGNEFPGVRSR